MDGNHACCKVFFIIMNPVSLARHTSAKAEKTNSSVCNDSKDTHTHTDLEESQECLLLRDELIYDKWRAAFTISHVVHDHLNIVTSV